MLSAFSCTGDMKMSNFHQYFLEYMGANDDLLGRGERIFPSATRVSPESSGSYSLHHLIVAEYNGMLIHSIAPEYLAEYKKVAPQETSDELLEQVDDAFFSVNHKRYYRIREMLRYTIDHPFEEESMVTVLGPEHRDLIQAAQNRRGSRIREWMWNRSKLPLLKEGRVLSVISDGRIVSRSNIIDMLFSAVNIDVWTHEDYRRKGYGMMCVKQAVNWCLRNDRVPVYLVHTANTPSVDLAENLGFSRMTREIQTLIMRY